MLFLETLLTEFDDYTTKRSEISWAIWSDGSRVRIPSSKYLKTATYFDEKSFSDNQSGIGLFDHQMVLDHVKMIVGDDMAGFRDDSFDESIDSVQFFEQIWSNLIEIDRFYQQDPKSSKNKSESIAKTILETRVFI